MTNETSITLSIPDDLEKEIAKAYPPDRDLDKFHCAVYVYLREPLFNPEPPSIREMAAFFDVHPKTVYRWISRWRQDGTLDRVRRFIQDLLFEEIKVAELDLLRALPLVHKALIAIALDGKSDKNRIEAAKLIMKILDPALEKLSQTDSGISRYVEGMARRNGKFDPLRS